MEIKLVGWDDLPSHMKPDKNRSALYCLIYSADGTLVDYFSNQESNCFGEMSHWIQKAYQLGRGEFSPFVPQKRSLAFISHQMALYYRNLESSDPFNKKLTLKESLMWDEVSRRFAGGLEIYPIYDSKNSICAYKIRGESGYTYSVDETGSQCTCQAAQAQKDCWHILAVQTYIKAVKALQKT